MKPSEPQQNQLSALKRNIIEAYQRQIGRQGCYNARISTADLIDLCAMHPRTRNWLSQTGECLKLSGRSLHRCLRVGRTIADLEGRDEVTEGDLSEALAYRKDIDPAL